MPWKIGVEDYKPWKKPAQRVLCVCKENVARSPMMAALLQKELGKRFLVESAGILEKATGKPADEETVLCMKEKGFDISGHVGRWVDNLDLTSFSHIVCVNEEVEARIMGSLVGAKNVEIILANENHGGIPLSQRAKLPSYRKCFALLEKVVPEIAEQIRKCT